MKNIYVSLAVALCLIVKEAHCSDNLDLDSMTQEKFDKLFTDFDQDTDIDSVDLSEITIDDEKKDEQQLNEPEGTESQAAAPQQAAKPQMAKPPQLAKPQTDEPEGADSQTVEPQQPIKPQLTEPQQLAEPQVTVKATKTESKEEKSDVLTPPTGDVQKKLDEEILEAKDDVLGKVDQKDEIKNVPAAPILKERIEIKEDIKTEAEAKSTQKKEGDINKKATEKKEKPIPTQQSNDAIVVKKSAESEKQHNEQKIPNARTLEEDVKMQKIKIQPRPVYSYKINEQDLGISNERAAEIAKRNKELYENALFAAIEADDISAVKAAISKGANINCLLVRNMRTPLMYAIHLKRPGIAKYLITRGADLNKQDIDGKTALHLAFMKNQVDIASILFMAGADVEVQDKKCARPLIYLRNSKIDKEILGRLARRYVKQNNLLIDATTIGYIDGIKYSLLKGAYVNFTEKGSACSGQKGNTPLLIAILNGDMRAVSALLNNGADIYARNKDGLNPILVAKSSKNDYLLSVLKTAEVNRKMDKYKKK